MVHSYLPKLCIAIYRFGALLVTDFGAVLIADHISVCCDIIIVFFAFLKMQKIQLLKAFTIIFTP